jgi:hypothetical protein
MATTEDPEATREFHPFEVEVLAIDPDERIPYVLTPQAERLLAGATP